MKRIRTLFIFLLFIVFLLITVFAPPAVSRAKDRMLFGKVITQQLTDTEDIAKTELSMEDKIALIAGYKAGRDDVIMVSQDRQTYNQGNKQNLADIAADQLNKLKDMGLFPPVEINEKQDITVEVQSYTNIDEPSKNAEILEISFSFDNNWVGLMMDADTQLVLQYNLWTNDPLKYTPVKGTLNLFAKYLGIKSPVSTLEMKSDTEEYKYSKRAYGYYFAQVHEDKMNGIHIVPAAD